MKILLDGIPVDLSDIYFNDGLNYGRFFDHDPLFRYSLTIECHDLIRNFGKIYQKVLDEIKEDDEKYADSSPFKEMGYVPLSSAFQFPHLLSEAVETYFDRKIFHLYIPKSDSYRYVINSTDRIVVSDDQIVVEGHCFKKT